MTMRQVSKVLTKRAGGTQVGVDITKRTATFIFSSNSPDRMGDIVDQDSMITDRYMQNPIFLWGHQQRELPIGKTIDLRKKGNQTIGTVQFPDEGTYDFADTCWKLVAGGYLNAVSVGFLPHRWESYSDDTQGVEGYKFFDCELLECSLVPIPANQDALISAKDLGDLAPMYRGLLDGYQDDNAGVYGRDQIEAVLRSFGTKSEPNMKMDDDIDGQPVYDVAGELMGLMVGGALKMARTYQDRLRNRNAALIDQQATALTVATTEEKTAPIVGPNFFLKRQASRALARRTLLGV